MPADNPPLGKTNEEKAMNIRNYESNFTPSFELRSTFREHKVPYPIVKLIADRYYTTVQSFATIAADVNAAKTFANDASLAPGWRVGRP